MGTVQLLELTTRIVVPVLQLIADLSRSGGPRLPLH